jgi:hypothetical protein
MKAIPYPTVLWTCVLGMLLMILPIYMSQSQPNPYHAAKQWKILPSSYIQINGKSNVNTFGCKAIGQFKTTPLAWLPQNNGQLQLKGSIVLAVNALDCNHKILNQDLRKTLKADTHPLLNIQFLNLERVPDIEGGVDYISGKVQIELAGTKKTVDIRYTISPTANGLKLEGSRAFCFQDFQLSPPQKVGGLIKVKDQFDVSFALYLQE